MTPRQIALVRESWRRVLPVKEHAAALFYQRLFELDSGLQLLFRGNMTEQGHKLMAMLGTVVSCLDRFGDIVPVVQRLGRRHAQYGVEDGHYATVGTVLLSTLRDALGDALSREAEDAWAVAFTTLAEVMQQASAEAVPRPIGEAPPRQPGATDVAGGAPPIAKQEPIDAAVRA